MRPSLLWSRDAVQPVTRKQWCPFSEGVNMTEKHNGHIVTCSLQSFHTWRRGKKTDCKRIMFGNIPKCLTARSQEEDNLQITNKDQVGRRKWVKIDPQGTQTTDKRHSQRLRWKKENQQINSRRSRLERGRQAYGGWSWCMFLWWGYVTASDGEM